MSQDIVDAEDGLRSAAAVDEHQLAPPANAPIQPDPLVREQSHQEIQRREGASEIEPGSTEGTQQREGAPNDAPEIDLGNAEENNRNAVPESDANAACEGSEPVPGNEETHIKELHGLNLNEERPDVDHPDSIGGDHQNDRPPDGGENEERVEIDAINEGAQRPEPVQAVPIENQEDPDARHEDKWEDVIDRFANPNRFFTFASSSNGLRMSDTEIKKIQHSDKEPRDQTLDVMRKWKKDNEGATCKELEDIVNRYIKGGRQPNLEEHPNQDQAVNPDQNDVRIEDVFEKVSKSFASMSDFKKFARASKGLGLSSDDVNQIETDHRRNSYRQKIEMLRLWKENADDPTPQKLKKIREDYQNTPRR